LRELGIYEEALELFYRARTINEEAYGPIHPTVARDINNIGCALKDLGKFQEAQDVFKDALTIYEKAYNLNHPEVAVVINRIGVLLKGDGRLEKQNSTERIDIDKRSWD
jgi:tetratricopeptide (TPR) repeat protein